MYHRCRGGNPVLRSPRSRGGVRRMAVSTLSPACARTCSLHALRDPLVTAEASAFPSSARLFGISTRGVVHFTQFLTTLL